MMTRGEFEKTLQGLLQQTPFKPFRIEFDAGEPLVVEHPREIMYHGGGSQAVYLGDPLTFVHCDGVRQFLELAAQPSG